MQDSHLVVSGSTRHHRLCCIARIHIPRLAPASLSQECLKLSTDKYGVGVLDSESVDILSDIGFSHAGPSQIKLFTETTDTQSTQLLYKTKFCDAQPWGQPDLIVGSEEEVSERTIEWLSGMGIPSYEKPTVHKINPSTTGSCGTDAGLAILVSVPAWSEVHLTPYGFQTLTPSFIIEKSQIYPLLSPTQCQTNADCVIAPIGNFCGKELVGCMNEQSVENILYSVTDDPELCAVAGDTAPNPTGCACKQNVCTPSFA